MPMRPSSCRCWSRRPLPGRRDPLVGAFLVRSLPYGFRLRAPVEEGKTVYGVAVGVALISSEVARVLGTGVAAPRFATWAYESAAEGATRNCESVTSSRTASHMNLSRPMHREPIWPKRLSCGLAREETRGSCEGARGLVPPTIPLDLAATPAARLAGLAARGWSVEPTARRDAAATPRSHRRLDAAAE